MEYAEEKSSTSGASTSNIQQQDVQSAQAAAVNNATDRSVSLPIKSSADENAEHELKEVAVYEHSKEVMNYQTTRTVQLKEDETETTECAEEMELEREFRTWNFMVHNEELIQTYGQISRIIESKLFLQTHTHLVCDDVSNYLVVWSINLISDEKLYLAGNVAQQLMFLQYILEMGKYLGGNPISCVSSFFCQVLNWDAEDRNEFLSDVRRLTSRLTKFAKGDLCGAYTDESDADEEPIYAEPVQSINDLPLTLKRSIESLDRDVVQGVFASIPKEVSKYYFKSCIKSGIFDLSYNINVDMVKPVSTTETVEMVDVEEDVTIAIDNLNENNVVTVQVNIDDNNETKTETDTELSIEVEASISSNIDTDIEGLFTVDFYVDETAEDSSDDEQLPE